MKKNGFEMEVLKQQLWRDPNRANDTWNILEHAINDISTHQKFGAVSFKDLYRHASDMVVNNFGEKLYSGLVTTVTSHLSGISKLIEDAQGELLLEELNRRWADHNKALQRILDMLVQMERRFIPWNHKTPIRELGFNLWRDIVMPTTRLRDTLLELVCRERNGDVINRELMRNIIKMLTDLGSSVYEEVFEQPFLEVSVDFNRLKSQQFIEYCDCRDYLKAERCLNEDIERVSYYLDPRSLDKIAKLVEKEMIENHMHKLFEIEKKALVDLVVNDKYEDLGMQYNLFYGVPTGLSIVRDVVNLYIWDTGEQLATNLERLKDPVDFVQRLLNLKDKLDKIISLAFNNDDTLQNALNSSFEYFINLKPWSAEFISLFVDDKFRKRLKGVSEEDLEVALDKVMMLFRYLQKKDRFEMYYRLHLAKRLRSMKTISIDAERRLIDKLKTECGHQFTSKLEGMLIDNFI